jgi:hypothetical protein
VPLLGDAGSERRLNVPEDDEKDRQIAELRRDLGVAKRRASDAETKASELEASQAKLTADQDRLIAAAKLDGRAEGANEARAALAAEHGRDLATVRVQAEAAKQGIDADLALRLVDMTKVMGTDGKPDDAAMTAAFEEMTTRWPSIKVAPGTPPPSVLPPRGDGDGGARPPAGRADPDGKMNDQLRDYLKH